MATRRAETEHDHEEPPCETKTGRIDNLKTKMRGPREVKSSTGKWGGSLRRGLRVSLALATVLLIASGASAQDQTKSNAPSYLVATNPLTGTAVDLAWSAPTCNVGDESRTHSYVLTVFGPGNDDVFEQRDDFAAQICTDPSGGGTPQVTTARVENLERHSEYKIAVVSNSEGLGPSEGEKVKVELKVGLSTCYYETDSTVCECSPGESHSDGACRECPADTYSANGTQCVSCPLGATSAPGSKSLDECVCPIHSINLDGTCVCKKGYGGDATVKSQGCKACQIVGYKEVDWNEPCIVCPLGASIPFHISAASDSKLCRCSDGSEFDDASGECKCSLGYFGSANDASCHPCPFGSYKDFLGDSESCLECVSVIGEGATTDDIKSNSSEACTCKYGFVRVGNECINCPVGADCSKRQIKDVAGLPGYWRYSENSTKWNECEQPLGFHVCENSATQDSSGVVTKRTCRKGHLGVLCASCEHGWGKNLGVCTECSTGLALPILGCIFGFLLLLLVLYIVTFEGVRRIHFIIFPTSGLKVDYTTSSYLKIFVNWLQMVSLALYLKIPKNHSMETMFQIQTLGQLHPWAFQSFNCLFSLDFYTRVYYAMLVPLCCVVAGLAFSGGLLLSGILGKRPQLLDLWLMNTQILWFLTYCGVVHTVFEVFACRQIDDGRSVLYADSSISCDTKEHEDVKLRATLFACFFCCGQPLQLLAHMWWRRDDLEERKCYIRYSFFTLNYKKEYFWYEAFCMLRKLLIIFVVTLIQEDTRRQIFLLSLLSVLYLGIHSYLSPFTKHALNELESHALFTMAFTYNVCVLFQEASNVNNNDFEMSFTWCVILLNFAIAVHCCTRIARSFLTLRGVKRSERQERAMPDEIAKGEGRRQSLDCNLDAFMDGGASAKAPHLPASFSIGLGRRESKAPRYSTQVSNPLAADL